MGNQNKPSHQSNSSQANQPGHLNRFKCPKCHFQFPASTNIQQFAQHIETCIANQQQNLQSIISVVKQSSPFQYEKVPTDFSMIKFSWVKKPIEKIDPTLFKLEAYEVRKLSFQQKEAWLRNELEKLRISWQNGADFMRLERSNILMCSFMEVMKVNMHKEVKIEFIGEKVQDAGGLLREWIHMVFKEIFDDSTGIFMPANTEDITYKLKWDGDLDEEFTGELFELFGIILGKAIFQKIPLTCYLDRTLLRQLCDNPVKIEDIYGFDKDYYKNWLYILETDNVEELETYFVINKDMGDTIEEIELKQGGKDIIVNDKNKFEYVDLCIDFLTIKNVERSIKRIKIGLERVIPKGLLQPFHPYQLEMLLNGVPFIDLQDWKTHTTYQQPYSHNHNVIKWFWTVMSEFDQQQLSQMLHFSTGSSRTPIHGFIKLESNRGNYSKFLIVPCPFVKTNPYPKGHTCFNRLELPQYPNIDTLRTYLTALSKSNLDGVFGLD